MTIKSLENWFHQHKEMIEKEYQKELDRLAGEGEPEILSAFDENDQYESERDSE